MLKHFPILAKKYRNPEVNQKNRANIFQKVDKQTFLYYILA